MEIIFVAVQVLTCIECEKDLRRETSCMPRTHEQKKQVECERVALTTLRYLEVALYSGISRKSSTHRLRI